ncbi:EF-hand domain-containing protein 1 [Physocladia obscura]|uniref:EF-hand domain-containing protein 1 n=1 Tax=Physocladia obscura TaxID=109957 RepID=A0AAD5T6G1_9FUNG|nr:EF-hand domain-containing protein 1 [Physocladia obscura]
MATHEAIPFLPGNTFRDVTKTDYRKPHSLGYKNGYPIQPQPILGIGLDPIQLDPPIDPESLLHQIDADPAITYGYKQFHFLPAAQRFLPAHVVFDKVVLRFDAYFKQTVHESTEQYHLRKVKIYYFPEDDSISVVEPPVENSGIPQGVLIKRQRLPKNSQDFYLLKDFNVGINVTFYGKTFRIVSCDKFTQRYLKETENIDLNPFETVPTDLYQAFRNRPLRNPSLAPAKEDKLRRFLENDRKVLRFFCIWDDRDSMFGEAREFVLHYYLVDDCVEVREVRRPNNGRDPFPILLKRQRLPKSFWELSDVNDSSKYTWKDFKIGGVINVLGRRFLIRDCDDYTKRFYADNSQTPYSEMQALPIDTYIPPLTTMPTEPEIPPYNGYGSVEDSLGSCKYLVLKPPKKDFIKMLENEHKVLRFVARMESKHKEDGNRRFVISYRLADDTMTIYEPPQRNAGILGGKFMERTRVLKPGSSLSSSNGPIYYDVADLYVGATLDVFKHHFVLLDADEFVFNYLEHLVGNATIAAAGNDANGGTGSGGRELASKKGAAFEMSNQRVVLTKLRDILVTNPSYKGILDAKIRNYCFNGVIDRKHVLEACKNVFGSALTEHEMVTLLRMFETTEMRKVDYNQLVKGLANLK